MPSVVISEFEIVAQPERPSGEAPMPVPPSGEAANIGARQIERLLRRHRERMLRIWAH